MKTLKLGMLATALLLITAGFFAGCKANIATPVSSDSFAANADEYKDTDAALKVTGITFAEFADTDSYQVTVKFNYPVNAEGVKGVEFHKLTDADEAWKMPVKKEKITHTGLKVAGMEAYFTVPTKNVDHLYVYVKASEIKAVNGIMLNQDEDEKWGEAGDDDYAHYKNLTGAALTGNVDFDKETGGDNVTFDLTNELLTNDDFTTSPFKLGSAADAKLVKKVVIPAADFISYYFDTNAYPTDDSMANELDGAANLLNKHLKLEQYDWKNNTWVDVPLNFAYDATPKEWVSKEINVINDRTLRFKWVDKDKIEMRFKSYGYAIRASLKNNDSKIEVATDSVDATAEFPSGDTSIKEGDRWPNMGNLTVTKTPGQVEITLTPNAVNFPLFITNNNTWFDVTVDNAEAGKKSLFAGFNAEKVVKDNFKCIRNDGTLIPIRSITLVQNDIATYPHAFNKIVIEFETNATATEVYISPEVRTASFKGSYNDGSKDVEVAIPPLCFANIKPSGNPYEQSGWLKK